MYGCVNVMDTIEMLLNHLFHFPYVIYTLDRLFISEVDLFILKSLST